MDIGGWPHEGRYQAKALLDYLQEGLPILDHRRATQVVCCYSDACPTGMAGLICGIGELWACDISNPTCELALWHIGGTEAIALYENIRRICQNKPSRDKILIKAWVDNLGLCAAVNRKRACAKHVEMDFLIQEIWDMIRYHKCWLHCYWLSSKSNKITDAASRIFEIPESSFLKAMEWRMERITEIRVYAEFPQLIAHSPHWGFVPRDTRHKGSQHDMEIRNDIQLVCAQHIL